MCGGHALWSAPELLHSWQHEPEATPKPASRCQTPGFSRFLPTLQQEPSEMQRPQEVALISQHPERLSARGFNELPTKGLDVGQSWRRGH